VWEGHGGEGEAEVCFFREFLGEAVGAADQEDYILNGLVLCAAQPFRKVPAPKGATIDFERDDARALRDTSREAFGDLVGFPVFELDLFELGVSPNARVIVAEQRPQIAVLSLTNGDDSYTHDARVYGKTKPSSACWPSNSTRSASSQSASRS